VRVPEGQDVHAELASAFQKMGFKPQKAMAPVEGGAERVYKKMSIVRAYMGAVGWHHLIVHPKQMHDEEWLDAKMKELKVPAGLADTAEIRHTADGTISVTLKDAKKFKDAGWKCAYRSDKGIGGIFHQLLSGVGYAARKTFISNGVNPNTVKPNKSGQSANEDLKTGGSIGNFFRATDEVSNIEDHGVVLHPRVFERADWWHAGHDSWGALKTSGGQKHPDEHFHRNNTAHGTEIMFQGNTAMEDLLCAVVDSPSERKALIAALKKNGVHEVTGRPLEEFIVDQATARKMAEKAAAEWQPEGEE